MTQLIRLTGRVPYRPVHRLQEALVNARASGELDHDVVLLLEHEETITVGRRRGALSNVLVPQGVPVVEVERGGDVTYHGPGQLVAYPIVQLGDGRQDLWDHMQRLESAVIAVLGEVGLEGQRDSRNTGVWLSRDAGMPQKVCSVGIACRRWVTWHGLALNVDVDLRAFARIRPCGFGADVMTRLADHMVETPSWDVLWRTLAASLVDTLQLPSPRIQEMALDEVSAAFSVDVARSGAVG